MKNQSLKETVDICLLNKEEDDNDFSDMETILTQISIEIKEKKKKIDEKKIIDLQKKTKIKKIIEAKAICSHFKKVKLANTAAYLFDNPPSSSSRHNFGGNNVTPDPEYVQGVLNGSGGGTINGYGIEINGESL